MVDEVRAHVADGADAPIHPTPPVERMIDGVIGDIRRGSAKKEIPTESARNGIVPGHRGSQALIYTLAVPAEFVGRSEEHTSELQSRVDLVCRLLLEKKK